MKQLISHQAIILLAALLVFFTNLGQYSLFDNEEPMTAGCAAEMFRRSDLIQPTFNQEPKTDQSILIYWFMMTAYRFFGVTEFSARLTSSIMAVGTTLLTYHLGRKLYSAKVGFLGALILCTCLMFSAIGRSATSDSTLVFFVTLTFTSYVWIVSLQRSGHFSLGDLAPKKTLKETVNLPESTASESAAPTTEPAVIEPLFPANWKSAIPIYVALGFAGLARGPVGLILPGGSLLLFLLFVFRDRDLAAETIKQPEGPWWRKVWITSLQLIRLPKIVHAMRGMNALIGVAVVAVIVLPWYLTIGFVAHGTWLYGFLIEHNFWQSIFSSQGNDGKPLYHLYYILILLIGCFPWSVYLGTALYRMQQRLTDFDHFRNSDLLVACWAGSWFIFFSLASTRSANYILPAVPAISLILARYFHEWQNDKASAWIYSFIVGSRAMMITGVIMVFGITFGAYVYAPHDQWLAIAGLIPIAGGFAATKLLEREQRERVVQCLLGTSLLLAFLLVGIAPARLAQYQDTKAFMEKAKALAVGAEINVGTFDYYQPSVVFYSQNRVTVLKTPREVADFLSNRPHAFLITPQTRYNDLRDELRDNVSELMNQRQFLNRTQLLLLGDR